jgi:peptidoglycan/LPS O-acetylase OafA/YrhL
VNQVRWLNKRGPLTVLLVVLYHAGVPGLTGGFVGVDVFFVLSGFVITGLLLRERASAGATRLLAFYGRRSRRILPAATLVIMLTVLASYHWLGFIAGDDTARTGRSASLFYANFHFISVGTN